MRAHRSTLKSETDRKWALNKDLEERRDRLRNRLGMNIPSERSSEYEETKYIEQAYETAKLLEHRQIDLGAGEKALSGTDIAQLDYYKKLSEETAKHRRESFESRTKKWEAECERKGELSSVVYMSAGAHPLISSCCSRVTRCRALCSCAVQQ